MKKLNVARFSKFMQIAFEMALYLDLKRRRVFEFYALLIFLFIKANQIKISVQIEASLSARMIM